MSDLTITIKGSSWARVTQERDMARDMVHGLRKQRAIARKFGEQMERERDEAQEALREIQAADWKTAGELRGMARRALEAAK